MCGWAVWKYLLSFDGPEGNLRKRVREVAGKLAALRRKDLKSATFSGKSDIFVRAQILRFLACQAEWKGELFDGVLFNVRSTLDKPSSKETKKLHSFFVHYCVLALEQVREPIDKLANGILEVRDPLDAPSVRDWRHAVTLLERANDLLDRLESLAPVIRCDLLQSDAADELQKLVVLMKDSIKGMAAGVRDGDIRQAETKLSDVRQILEDSSSRVADVLSKLPSSITNLDSAEAKRYGVKGGWGDQSLSRTWTALKAVANRIRKEEWYKDPLCDRLREQVRLQISYASCGDFARLDVGSLAYGVAAAIKTKALRPSSLEVKKALSIIFENHRGGRWTQVQPIWRTAQGTVKIPLNIEIPNAVLPVIMRQVDVGIWSSWAGIDEIIDWVLSTRNTVGEHTGWCNEQTYSPDRIDFYVTAQVVQFLWHYRELRRRLVIQSALDRAGLTCSRPDAVSTKWEKLQPTDLEQDFERQIKSRLQQYFVTRFRRTRKLKESSVLLYGPPGTSKTSIMEALANKLGWPFLSISPAEFLATGGEQVEARATVIFEILSRAENLVVLFDEVDELLLDREARAEERPQGIFRFMTTSMLPKLQSLKHRRSIIFGIATNYRERLDKAITRQGRVDHDIAVLPPDLASRTFLATEFWETMGLDAARAVAAKTPFFSYQELKDVVEKTRSDSKLNPWKATPHPRASPEGYSGRAGSDDEFQALLDAQIKDASPVGPDAKTVLCERLAGLAKKPDKLKPETVEKIKEKIAVLGCP